MTTPENSLGLQLEQLQIADEPAQSVSPDVSAQGELSQAEQTLKVDKKKQKPYINPERFKTGGPQREKPSDEELAERMQRIKAQNERIKQRRLDVEADEEAFRKTEQEERIKRVQTRKVQETVNRAREQNARRKLEKIQTREWDSGKSATTAESKTSTRAVTQTSPSQSQPGLEVQGLRGGSGGRRGQGTQRRRGGSKGLAHNSSHNVTQAASPPQLPSQDEVQNTVSDP